MAARAVLDPLLILQIKSKLQCERLGPSSDSLIGPASARSYKIGVVGNNCLVCWLVGNAVFSETAQSIF